MSVILFHICLILVGELNMWSTVLHLKREGSISAEPQSICIWFHTWKESGKFEICKGVSFLYSNQHKNDSLICCTLVFTKAVLITGKIPRPFRKRCRLCALVQLLFGKLSVDYVGERKLTWYPNVYEDDISCCLCNFCNQQSNVLFFPPGTIRPGVKLIQHWDVSYKNWFHCSKKAN